MKIHEAASPEFEALSGTDIFVHGHLPIVSAYCRRLGLAETVDRMVPSQMQLRPGLAVQTMVLDVLSGRSPLYRVQEFMAEQDVELLLGEHVPAEMFNDTNLGRSLDAVFTAGTSKIITEMGVRAASIFGLDTGKVSYDTTSTSVWGDYQSCAGDDCPPGPVVTWGHSKDHRPDLKQFMTELLCVDSAVPIFGKTLDGNSSDKTSNNEILSRISSLMARHGLEEGAFVYVADSAMVTEGNLSAMGGNRFVSRLPANYAECGRAIAAAVAEGQWHHAGRLAETPTGVNRPNAEYKLQERVVNLHGTDYRAVVVHSSSHDRRRRKKVDRILAESQKALVAELGKLETVYFCRADAEAAAAKVGTLAGKMHSTVPEITETCRRKRGRPPKDGPASTTTRYMLSWRIVEDTAAVEKARAEAGCFVLLTNVPLPGEGGMDAAAKNQGILRANFPLAPRLI